MREINNNNLDLSKMQSVPTKVDAGKTDPQVPPTKDGDEKLVKDFSNQPAEALGRSQVQGLHKSDQDVAFGLKNPEQVIKANKLFDIVYDNGIAKGLNGE